MHLAETANGWMIRCVVTCLCISDPLIQRNIFCLFQLYNDTFHIWTRPITPPGSYAIAAVYSKQQGYPIHVTLPLSAIHLNASHGYKITEVFDNKPVGYLKAGQNLTYIVNPSGIYFLRATSMK